MTEMGIASKIVFVGFFLLRTAWGSEQSLVASHTKLLKDLLEPGLYDRRVPPIHNYTEPISLGLGIRVLSIDNLYEHDYVMETSLHIQQIWHDFRLSWNPANYQRLHVIHVPVQELWQPDVYVFNNAEAAMDSVETLAIVFTGGYVFYSPKVRVRSRCQMDLTHFPYDSQECVIKIGSFTYDGLRLNLTKFHENNTFDLSDYEANKEWTIVESDSTIVTKTHSCCQEPYPYMQFRFKLKRTSLYYTYAFVLPSVLLAMSVPIQFLVPPNSGDRMSLGTLLVLSSIVMMSLLHNFLPTSHDTLPNLVKFYSMTILWSVTALVTSAIVVNINGRGYRNRKLPGVVRQVFLKTLRKLVCLSDDTYVPLDDVDTVSFKTLEKQHQPLVNEQVNDHVHERPVSSCSLIDTSKSDRNIEEILRQMNILVARLAFDARTDVRSEWNQLARVLDRIGFILFMFIFVVSSLVLL